MSRRGPWIVVAFLSAALAASIALGLFGLWPDLRGGQSVGDRRETIRLSSAFDDLLARKGGSDWHVTRVRLDYVPRRAMLELQRYSTGRRACAVVSEDFGDVLDGQDVDYTACDFD
jgi:hypothetical protein